LSALSGLPCAVGGFQGTTSVGSGQASGTLASGSIAFAINCSLQPFTPPGNPFSLGFIALLGSLTYSSPYTAGTPVNDWYSVSFTGQSSSQFNPQVRLSATDPNLAVDAVVASSPYAIVFVGMQLGAQFPTNNNGQYLLHVYGTPTTSDSYTLQISN
jgi:hypothetical protein